MAEDTLPLNFEEFERIMIYNALTDSSYLDAAIEYIVPSYFQCKDTRTVFSILAHFYGVHKKVPNLTELKAHIIEEEHKSSLKAVVKSFEGIDKHYDKDLLLINTERFLKEKAVLATSIRTHVAIQSGRYEPAKILHEFEAACGISLVNSIGMDYLESIDQHCKDLQEVFQVIPTGWKWLDERIGGGLQAKGRAVYAFYGVTNVGKSIFLGNLAANILSQDKSVLLVTLEMSEQMYAKRISAQLSKIPFDNLPQEIEALKGSLGTYKLKHRKAKLIIKEFPPKGINPLQLKAYIERMKRKGIKFDVIVLDYLNLLAPLTHGVSSYEAIKEIAEQLRALTYYFSCPLVTASQTNRSGYGQVMPALETTSESMGLAHTVDCQMPIWTEEEDFDLGVIHLGITKNRFGPRECSTILQIDYPTLSLTDPDEVSKAYSPPVPNIPGSLKNKKPTDTSLNNTLDLIEKLGEN
jgi:replicative DNA helicase